MSGPAVRFGEADLSTCDREPIHIPGSIQPHGLLLVIDREELTVEQVAGNSSGLLGRGLEGLLGQSLSVIFEHDTDVFLRTQLASPASFVAPSMRLGVRSRSGNTRLDLTLHAHGRTAIVELEPARRTMQGGGDPIEQLKTLLAAVQHTADLDGCCAAAAVSMRAATGFDRAMVYRFLPDESGMVAAEDAAPGLESFLGLHYPASDIPKQARELYRRNWLRAIPNIDYVAAPLRPAQNPRTQQPIDMSDCDLRSVSPIHLEYLRNMGVCASLSASIICEGQLWGMLVLHHYSPRQVSADLRVACETFAQILSLHVDAKVKAETAVLRNESRGVRAELIGRLTATGDIGGVLASADLLRYLGAGGAAVYVEGELHLAGETPGSAQIPALVAWLNQVNRPLFATDRLASHYPPAATFAATASGLLAVGLSREPRDYVLWFRPEIGRTVRWAGDPSKPIKVDRHGARLTPRGSFAEWLEVTRMQSAAWSPVDLEAAEALRVVFLESVLKSMDLARAEHLEKRVAQRTSQLRALAVELEAAEDRERRQIAHDLHDDLGQTLAAARIRLAALCGDERAEVRSTALGVGELIDRANDAIRSLAAQLAPDVLHELGISPALEWLGEEVERTFGLRVILRDDGLPKPLSQDMRSILYRAVRELLINVAKHARTPAATIDANHQDGRVVVSVRDEGAGFDVAAVLGGFRRGSGIVSVRERLALLGGSVEIRSAPGAGTTAVVSLPVTDELPHALGGGA